MRVQQFLIVVVGQRLLQYVRHCFGEYCADLSVDIRFPFCPEVSVQGSAPTFYTDGASSKGTV